MDNSTATDAESRTSRSPSPFFAGIWQYVTRRKWRQANLGLVGFNCRTLTSSFIVWARGQWPFRPASDVPLIRFFWKAYSQMNSYLDLLLLNTVVLGWFPRLLWALCHYITVICLCYHESHLNLVAFHNIFHPFLLRLQVQSLVKDTINVVQQRRTVSERMHVAELWQIHIHGVGELYFLIRWIAVMRIFWPFWPWRNWLELPFFLTLIKDLPYFIWFWGHYGLHTASEVISVM